MEYKRETVVNVDPNYSGKFMIIEDINIEVRIKEKLR